MPNHLEIPSLDKLAPNPDWASLPIFSRKGWKRVRFGEVVRQLKEQVDPQSGEVDRYVAGEHMDSECVHIRRWGEVGDGYLGPAFHRRFRKGQVLYGSRRTYLKKVAVAEWDGVTANTTFVLGAVEDKLLPEMLPWLMLSERFTTHSIQESKGSTNPYINFPDIAKFEFDLPPLDQQRRIAEILWAVDVVAASFKSVSHAVVGAVDTRLGELFGNCRFGVVPPFPTMPLKNTAQLQTGIAKGKKYGPSVETVDRPYLRVANVQDGHLDLSEIKTITLPKAEEAHYRLHLGDVVICEGGDFDKVGRGVMWREQVPNCLHQNHVFCIRADRSLVEPEFLALQLASPYGKQYFLKCAKKTSNLASINSTQVKAFPFQVPPLDEQAEIVAEIRTLRMSGSASAQQADALMQTLGCLLETTS